MVSAITLVIWVIGAIILLNMALKTWVFTKADQNVYYYAPCASTVAPDGKTVQCDPAEQQRQKEMDKEQRSAQKQRDAAQAVAMILVAVPVWYGHWRLAKREA